MPKAPEIKPGHVVELDGQPFIVRKVDVHSPSARGASTLYKMTFNDLVTKRKREETYKGDELLTLADAQMRTVQYLYADGDMHTFMDAEDYAQHMLSSDDLDDTLPWLEDGMEGLTGVVVNDVLVAIELPQSVVRTILDCAPAIKGASASARTKPADLGRGLSVQVPEYIEVGERIKVNTESRKFMSRA